MHCIISFSALLTMEFHLLANVACSLLITCGLTVICSFAGVLFLVWAVFKASQWLVAQSRECVSSVYLSLNSLSSFSINSSGWSLLLFVVVVFVLWWPGLGPMYWVSSPRLSMCCCCCWLLPLVGSRGWW